MGACEARPWTANDLETIIQSSWSSVSNLLSLDVEIEMQPIVMAVADLGGVLVYQESVPRLRIQCQRTFGSVSENGQSPNIGR
jgi:hypothetical protein